MTITKAAIAKVKKFATIAKAGFGGGWFSSKEIKDDEDDHAPSTFTIGPYALEKNKACHYEDTICEVWDGEYDGKKNADYIASVDPFTVLQIIERLEKAEADNAELQRTFDLQYAADMRGIKAWQKKNPGNSLVWPDRGDLVEWQLARVNLQTGIVLVKEQAP